MVALWCVVWCVPAPCNDCVSAWSTCSASVPRVCSSAWNGKIPPSLACASLVEGGHGTFVMTVAGNRLCSLASSL